MLMKLSFVLIAGVLLAAGLSRLNGATFFGPTPYLSSNDIPVGLYVTGAHGIRSVTLVTASWIS